MADGRIALGYEGGLAVGFPGGSWNVFTSPNGKIVKVIEEGPQGVLIAGEGFGGLLSPAGINLNSSLSGDYINAVPLPDGWLLAGRDRVWLVRPNDDGSVSATATNAEGTLRLTRHAGEVVMSSKTAGVARWRGTRFEPFDALAGLNGLIAAWFDGDAVVTDHGILHPNGQPALPAEANRRELIGGIVGVAETGPWILVANFSHGISLYERESGRLVRNASAGLGNIYWFIRAGDQFLLGTAEGVFAMADPHRNEILRRPSEPLVDVVVNPEGKPELQMLSGSLTLEAEHATPVPDRWDDPAGRATIEGTALSYAGRTFSLPSRFNYGLATLPRSAAVVNERDIRIHYPDGTSIRTSLEGTIRGLATDGTDYLVATATQGVYRVSEQGQIKGHYGSGRAAVSLVATGRVILLFWDGTVLDAEGQRLAKVDAGNPRDAALVDEQLAVLVTRADGVPVVGWLDRGNWIPLDIPALADIGAEQIVFHESRLIVAGARGVVRSRRPLDVAAPPVPVLDWSAAMVGNEIRLPHSSDRSVRLTPRSRDLAPFATTRFHLRTGGDHWTSLQPGEEFSIPVDWGQSQVTLRSERNGLTVDQTFTLVRPWPWWLRPWAWLLHAGVFAGAVAGFVRLRTRRLERRNRELENRVAERTEQLRKASAAKEEFLAGISHEIRNPLNGVVGICAMLAEREVGPKNQLLVRTLGGCAEQLRSMLDDILDFSRIERGDVALANQDFELSAIVEESALIMDPELSACSLLLPDNPIWLHGDSGKLRQICCNLISNALKYGVPREAGIEVRTESVSGGRTRVRIAIRNSGPTIPAAEIPRLFESFQRGSRTTGIPGSGLGLAVCRRLIQAMGGRITAASAEGATEFAVEVTLANAQPRTTTAVESELVSRALAIEDEDYNRVVLGHVLRSLGYRVDWAADGAAAIKLAAERPYDLVLTDWRLPDMDGGSLCRRILALMPDPKPPVVAVTAYSTDEKLAEARQAGMTGFVTKPVTQEKLARVIRGLSVAMQPRRSLDTNLPQQPASPLATLGDLAPSGLKLAEDIELRWRNTSTMAELRDPRTAREAHALRSLLLLAGEESAAEQIALIESAADQADWPTVDQLTPFAAEEIAQSRRRLTA